MHWQSNVVLARRQVLRRFDRFPLHQLLRQTSTAPMGKTARGLPTAPSPPNPQAGAAGSLPVPRTPPLWLSAQPCQDNERSPRPWRAPRACKGATKSQTHSSGSAGGTFACGRNLALLATAAAGLHAATATGPVAWAGGGREPAELWTWRGRGRGNWGLLVAVSRWLGCWDFGFDSSRRVGWVSAGAAGARRCGAWGLGGKLNLRATAWEQVWATEASRRGNEKGVKGGREREEGHAACRGVLWVRRHKAGSGDAVHTGGAYRQCGEVWNFVPVTQRSSGGSAFVGKDMGPLQWRPAPAVVEGYLEHGARGRGVSVGARG